MQLTTVSMDRTEARRAFLEYRRSVRERHSDEDEAIMRAYREAAKGVALLRLSETLRLGGLTTIAVPQSRWDGRRSVPDGTRDVAVPRLAVARADVPFVWTAGVRQDGSMRLAYHRGSIGERETRKRIDLPAGTFERDETRRLDSGRQRIRALVPPIPPALRPNHHLRNYHILWEAEWEIDRTIPPEDPALLKHLGGDLYAVLAVWDLTPVEQAVLAGRTPTT